MAQPLVAVTAWRGEFPTYAGPQVLNTLETTYSEAMIAAGMIPAIVPNGQSPEAAGPILDHVEALVLTGGADIDPDTYDSTRVRVEGADIAVDQFEIALVTEARSRDLPVLAICRGLQLLNVALGGTLTQDVTAPGTAHEPIEHGYDPDEVEDRRHPVRLETGTLTAKIFGTDEIKVNTLHHQGVDRLATDLVAEGFAPDGLIEAASYRGEWWALGIQWHPERLPYDQRDPLFAALMEAIETRRELAGSG